MSYAIIRNAKYKASNLPSISRHNERQNLQYGNKDIDTTKSDLNYHLKQPKEHSYEKEFYRLKQKNQLKGNLRLTGKKQSNIACEFLITSDNDFFKQLDEDEIKRFFQEAYNFACKKCGEQNILSAVVHMDETSPHMHLTYIPVVKGMDRKGNAINKINCSAFWKGFNSYGILQDSFFEHMHSKGFNLERGESKEERRNHMSVEKYKAETLHEKKILLEQNIEHMDNHAHKLQEEIKMLRKELKGAEDIKALWAQIEAIEGKLGAFMKDKITINTSDFECLKELSKKSYVLEHELSKKTADFEHQKQLNKSYIKKIDTLTQETKALKNRNVDLKDKNMIMKRMLEKQGLSKEEINKTITDTQDKLQELAKNKKDKTDKFH